MRDVVRTPRRRRVLVLGAMLAALAACGHDANEGGLGPRTLDDEPRATLGGEGPLTLTFTSPKGQTWTPTEISVGFSKPMIPLDRAGTADETPWLELEPALEGEYRWLGTQVLTFVPDDPLPPSTSFTARVPSSVKSLDGSEIEGETSWTFETPRVRVARSDPYPGAQWQRPTSPVDLWFNQPVAPEALEAAARYTTVVGVGAPEATVAVRARLGHEKGRGESDPQVVQPEDLGPIDPRHLILEPASPLPVGADVMLTLDGDLRGVQGNLPMGETYTLDYSIYGPFDVNGVDCWRTPCDPESGFGIDLTNPVKWNDLIKALSIDPPVELPRIDDEDYDSQYPSASQYLSVRLKPRTTYHVTVKAGLRDQFDQALPADRTFDLVTGPFSPISYVDVDGSVIEAVGPHEVAGRFRNAGRVTLTLREMAAQDFLAWTYARTWSASSSQPLSALPRVVTRQFEPNPVPDVERVLPLALDPGFRSAKRGILALELRRPRAEGEYGDQVEVRLLRITDLGLTTKLTPRGLLVWATSLKTAKPTAGVKVALYRAAGNPLWEGRTDADGFAFCPPEKLALGADEYYPDRYIVIAEKDGDRSFLETSGSWSLDSWNFGVPFAWNAKPTYGVGSIFADRGIYRPGDTVHLKGLVRRVGDDGLLTPKDVPVKLVIWNPRGEDASDAAWDGLTTGAFGTFAADWTVPADAPLGGYEVRAEMDEGGSASLYGTFRVAEYKAPTFAVKAETEREEYVRGDTLSLTIAGEYLFGAPMTGANVRWWVTRSDGRFYAERREWEGFWFGQEEPWWESTAEAPLSGGVAEASGKLDAAGRIAGSTPLAFETMRGPATLTVEGEVTDLDRSTVANQRRVTVHPASFYVGVRRKGSELLTAGGNLEVELVALDPEENPRAGVPVTGILYRREWHTVREEGLGGRYDYETRPEDTEVARCSAVTAVAPVPCTAPVARAGSYVLQLSAADERGNPVQTSLETWVAGSGSVGWYRSDDHRMELIADKTEYRPGDIAKVLVQSPFPEAQLLVTVERAGLLMRRTYSVTGSAPVVEIPILESYRPNVYLSVLAVRGRTRDTPDEGGDDPGKPTYAMGMVKLPVEIKSKSLAVDIRPDRDEHAPGDEIEVSLAVRGTDGAGAPAEVTLFAVDEAVLQLTGYEPPDPLALFWAERSLSVRTAEMRQDVVSRRAYEENKGAEGGGGGGGPGPEGTLRRDFRTVAYWNPAVLTDAEGKATVRFRLPENLTRYRLMAVALTETDRFGTGRSEVRIVKPVLIRPALPRFLRSDDRFEAGVVVTDRSGPAGDAEITAEVQGLTLEGEARRTVHLDAGQSREVRFTFRTGAPGTATFRFRVRLGELEDAFEVTRPVMLPMVPETVATYGETLARAVEALGDLDRIRPDVGGLTVSLSSSALTGLQSSIDYLWYYPYACAEQLVSRIVPVVALKELCDGLALKLPVDADSTVRKAIADLAPMQRSDGGFGYWPDSWRSSTWLTGYVVWGLRRAQEREYPVPETLLRGALEYLHAALRRDATGGSFEYIDQATRAFLLYVLADAGEPEAGYQEALFDHYEELPLFARAYLARAFLLSSDECAAGDCIPVVELRRDLENHVFQTAEEAHFEENIGDQYRVLMQSGITTNAVVLDTLLQLDPNHPLATKVLAWLLQEREGGHWATTQDSALALLALARFYRVRESEEPDFTATVDFGGRRVAEERFQGRPAREASVEIAMEELRRGRGSELLVQRQGASGRLYYALSLHYARSDLPPDGIDRGFYLERRYEIVDLSKLRSSDAAAERPAAVTRVRAGDLVRVRLSIVVPQERGQVVVEDPLPAGLESVDFDLRTTSLSLRRAASGYEAGDNDPYGGYEVGAPRRDDYGYYGYYGYEDRDWSSEWWWTPFYHREDRDDRVLLFADELPAGVHHYEYLARAVTPGTFVVGPARAEEMYNPETFGRTGALTFTVEPPADE